MNAGACCFAYGMVPECPGGRGVGLLVLYDADTDTAGLTQEGSYMEILR